jgi:hypothetical protein
MKAPDTVVADIRRRLSEKWHTDLVGGEAAFPHAFPLGRLDTNALRDDYAPIHAWTVDVQDWARRTGIVLDYENRKAKGGTVQAVPTRARVGSIDDAARIASGDWPERLERGRARFVILLKGYPQAIDIGRTLRLVDTYSAVDFELLLTVADWYLEDPARATLGVTPRQVPIPGVHAKWLQSHQAGVQALTGLADLGLLPRHPSVIHFTYLDPDHRAAGARVHDSAAVGDSFAPAYPPEVVIISENKDTAIHFLPLAGGISIEGVGKGGKTIASFPWIRDAPVVVYWGDMDRDGYEILDGYRADFDRDVDSILMDPETYEAYEQFGTDLDKHSKAITAEAPRPTTNLHADERAVYLRVLDVQRTGHRRLEQERIPLDRALEAVRLIREQSGSAGHEGLTP